jgi:lipid-A-disaccharide synthase-like uncharacterized protein
MGDEAVWLLLGFAGQAVFMGRFVIQWLASERDRRSVIPVSFWYLSIAGALVLLVYALHRRDPVFVAGQGLGVAIYLRNLQLIRRSADGARREQQRRDGEPPQRFCDGHRPRQDAGRSITRGRTRDSDA